MCRHMSPLTNAINARKQCDRCDIWCTFIPQPLEFTGFDDLHDLSIEVQTRRLYTAYIQNTPFVLSFDPHLE